MKKVTNSLDTQYNSIVGDVIKTGVVKTDRTGTGTYSKKGLQFRLKMSDGFPLITTKKVSFPFILKELLWFLRGDTSQRTLKETGCSIWDDWADKQGRLGPVYGAMWCRRPAANIEYVKVTRQPETPSTDGRMAAVTKGDVWLNHRQAAIYLRAQRAGRNTSGRTDIPLSCFQNDFIRYACDNESKKNFALGEKYTIAYTQWKNILKLVKEDQTRVIHRDWMFFSKFLDDFSTLPGNELCGTRNTEIFLTQDQSTKQISKKTVQFIRFEDRSYLIEAALRTRQDKEAVSKKNFIWQPVFYVNQIENVIKQIKAHSDSRRIIVDGWEPSLLPLDGVKPCDQAIFGRQALPPCHTMFQFFVDPAKEEGGKKRLSLHLMQRSADTCLGIPYNIASYAIMLELFAKMADLEAYELIITGGDVHVYKNHVTTALKQVKRVHRKLPKLTINGDISDVTNLKLEQFVVEGYTHGPVTKYPVAV